MPMSQTQYLSAIQNVVNRAKGEPPPQGMPTRNRAMPEPQSPGTRSKSASDLMAADSPKRTDADKAKAKATLDDFIKNGGTLKDVMPKMDDDPLMSSVPAPNLSAADKAAAQARLDAAIKAGGIAPKAMPYIPGGEMPPGVVAGNGSNPATPGLLESIANAAGGGNYTIPVPGLANGGTPPAAPPAIPASPNFVNGIEDYWKLSNDERQQAVKDFTNWAPGQMAPNQIMNWTDWLGAATNPTQGTAPTSTKLSQEQFNLLSRDEQLKLLNPGHLFESGLNQDGAAGQYAWGGPQAGYEFNAHDYSGYGAGLKEYGKQTNHADKYGDKVAGQFSAGLLNSIEQGAKQGDAKSQFIANNLKSYMDDPGGVNFQVPKNMMMRNGPSDPLNVLSMAYDHQQGPRLDPVLQASKDAKEAEKQARRAAKKNPPPLPEEDAVNDIPQYADGTMRGAFAPMYGNESQGEVNPYVARPYVDRGPGRADQPRIGARPSPYGQRPRPPMGGQVRPPSGPPLPTGGVVDGGWHSPRPVQPYNPNVPGGTQGQRPNGLPIPAPVPNDSWGPVTPASGGFWEGPANPQPSIPVPPMGALPPGGGMVSGPSGPMPTGGVTNNMNGPVTSPGMPAPSLPMSPEEIRREAASQPPALPGQNGVVQRPNGLPVPPTLPGGAGSGQGNFRSSRLRYR